MIQIQVPVLTGGGSGAGRWNKLSDREGEEVELREGPPTLERARLCIEDRLEGLGTRVILAEDLNSPA